MLLENWLAASFKFSSEELFDTIRGILIVSRGDKSFRRFARENRPCRGIYSGENGDARQRQKFDIQKVSRESKFDFGAVCDHRSAVFFFFSLPFFFFFPSSRVSPFRSLSLSLSSSSRGAARPEVAQTRQGSYSLEERVLRVTAGCSLFLDYSTAMPG